jgi:hypothetical protein
MSDLLLMFIELMGPDTAVLMTHAVLIVGGVIWMAIGLEAFLRGD